MLGDFASVSATFASLYPEAEIIDNSGKPTGQRVARTNEDQIAFSGTLKSGVVVSFHFRAGLSDAKPGRVPFVWVIDGEESTIKVEGGSSFYHVLHPKNVFIKGEKWVPEQPLVDFTGNTEAAWGEIAKGKQGDYATFDDAVRVHKVLDAVRRSAHEGIRVNID